MSKVRTLQEEAITEEIKEKSVIAIKLIKAEEREIRKIEKRLAKSREKYENLLNMDIEDIELNEYEELYISAVSASTSTSVRFF